MKNKNIYIIGCILIILIIAIVIIVDPFKHTTKKIDINNDEEYKKYVNEFEIAGQVPNDAPEDDSNSGGTIEIDVVNLKDLLTYMDIDGYIDIKNKLTVALETMPLIYKDVNALGSNEIQDYYELNKKTIYDIYGIDDYNNFIKFNKMLEFLDNTEIAAAELDKNTMQEEGNIIKSVLILDSNKNKEQKFFIKIVTVINKNKRDCMLYFE